MATSTRLRVAPDTESGWFEPTTSPARGPSVFQTRQCDEESLWWKLHISEKRLTIGQEEVITKFAKEKDQ